MEIKRLNFNIPLNLHKRFKEIFPYRGELTAFLNRCMESAVATQVSEETLKQIDELMEQAREDVRERRR